MPQQKREWLNLGDTTVDLTQIARIAFGKDARLYAIAGDALAITAWTKDRYELAHLKRLASQDNGWVGIQPEESSEPDYDDSDNGEESTSANDERVCLKLVDKLVETSTRSGAALNLFSCGVFIGEVVGDEIVFVKEYLGL